MKYLALVTLGSSPGSGVAERIQTHKGMILSGAIMVNRISVWLGEGGGSTYGILDFLTFFLLFFFFWSY